MISAAHRNRLKERDMTISVGDKVPQTTFTKMTENGPEAVDSESFFKGRRVALFSVPGAFTPTCPAKHLPGFIEKQADLKGKGIDEIACTAVNAAFVMGAWEIGRASCRARVCQYVQTSVAAVPFKHKHTPPQHLPPPPHHTPPPHTPSSPPPPPPTPP